MRPFWLDHSKLAPQVLTETDSLGCIYLERGTLAVRNSNIQGRIPPHNGGAIANAGGPWKAATPFLRPWHT